VRDGRVVAAQVAEALGALFQIIDQQRRPAAAQDLHHFLDRAAGDERFHGGSWLQKGAQFTSRMWRLGSGSAAQRDRQTSPETHIMEPILIYGFPLGSSMGLVAALEWLRKPYRLCRVDMLGEMRDPSYARINPRHETPALVTDQGGGAHREHGDRKLARRTRYRAPASALSRCRPRADRMRLLMAFVNTGFTAAFSPLWAALEMKTPNPSMQSALRQWGAG
jgi:hypothetical protein